MQLYETELEELRRLVAEVVSINRTPTLQRLRAFYLLEACLSAFLEHTRRLPFYDWTPLRALSLGAQEVRSAAGLQRLRGCLERQRDMLGLDLLDARLTGRVTRTAMGVTVVKGTTGPVDTTLDMNILRPLGEMAESLQASLSWVSSSRSLGVVGTRAHWVFQAIGLSVSTMTAHAQLLPRITVNNQVSIWNKSSLSV